MRNTNAVFSTHFHSITRGSHELLRIYSALGMSEHSSLTIYRHSTLSSLCHALFRLASFTKANGEQHLLADSKTRLTGPHLMHTPGGVSVIASIKSFMQIVFDFLHQRTSVRHMQFQILRLARWCETTRKHMSYRGGVQTHCPYFCIWIAEGCACGQNF